MTEADPSPQHICQVFRAHDLYVIHGVNAGDGLLPPDAVCAGDIYALAEDAAPVRLALTHGEKGQLVAEGSDIGRAGETLRLTARYTLMAPDGDKLEVLLITLQGGDRVALPRSPMATGQDYTLLDIEDSPEEVPLADLLCVSFARGTMITLWDGRQCPIEDLEAGARILTRDHGAQPLRWLGRATLRAHGAVAPVVITAGFLGNESDLIVSPHHRVFIYQRQRTAGIAAELLVQAKHLVDGERVFSREGGVVDYFSLIFDRHEIIYAEGIPCESLMVNDATLNRLPPDLAAEVRAKFPGLAQVQHFGTEATRALLDTVGRDTILQGRGRKRD